MDIIQLAILLAVCFFKESSGVYQGIERHKCTNFRNSHVIPHSKFRLRINQLRNEMRIRASVQGSEIDAYIITSFDEHQSETVAESDERRQFLTGFTGINGDVVITLKSAALWTDERFLSQADTEVDCELEIFKMGNHPTIGEWLLTQLPPQSNVGADPHLVPHFMWDEWELELSRKHIRLVKIYKNLIDPIWGDKRPIPWNDPIKTHSIKYAGENWETKIAKLRGNLTNFHCDAMIVTSLTEIAYILNLRGNDIPYIPVFKAYLLVTLHEIFLYTNTSRITPAVSQHLRSEPCHHENCVQVKDYRMVWSDLRTSSQQWKRILVPTHCVYDMGASYAIHSTLPKEIVVERISPIIFMRAQKNAVERAGMKIAHIRDAAAMCDILSYLEQQFTLGENWTEISLAEEIDRTRRSQPLSRGMSFQTVVAYGSQGAIPLYLPNNQSMVPINGSSTIVIDSGGQYLDGTTDVSRTLHLGKPTNEQIRAYTSVLAGMIRLSMLVFPESLKLSDIDILPRGSIWSDYRDYPHATGHGIGSFLSLHESPISIAYTTKNKYPFKEGYFFSNGPGFYKPLDFGIKLKNVLEVVDTGKRHPTGSKFLSFKDTTLIPFEPKLIDRTMLSAQEKRWLNVYNARIREEIGAELKRRTKLDAFYWMMNKTEHVIEYLPEKEYKRRNIATQNCMTVALYFTTALFLVYF